MTLNPREFLKIFNEQNIKCIMDDSYKLNLIRFENKEMRIIGKEAAMLRLQQKAVLRADSE